MDLQSHSSLMTFLEIITFKTILSLNAFRFFLINFLSQFLKKGNFHAHFTFLNYNYLLKQ
jgi:hypothetical protein